VVRAYLRLASSSLSEPALLGARPDEAASLDSLRLLGGNLNLVPASPGGDGLDEAWTRGTPCPLLPDDVINEALNTILIRGPWSLSCRARRNAVQRCKT
jgi:hypothetical protein